MTAGKVPQAAFRDGQRTVGDDDRVTFAAHRLAGRLWKGGGDEDYHFLLYLCGEAVEMVKDATDEYDTRKRGCGS